MLNLDNVKGYFAVLCDIEPLEAEKYSRLVKNSSSLIERRVKKGIDINGNLERLESAAAGVAYCEYLLLTLKGIAEEVRVGSVSVKNTNGGFTPKEVRDIRKYYLSSVSDLLYGSFVFASVGDGDDK